MNVCRKHAGKTRNVFVGNTMSPSAPLWFCMLPKKILGEHIVAASSVRPCTIFVRAISQQLMTGIQWNFMGSFTTKRRCAYYQRVLVGWFFTELWPFEIFYKKIIVPPTTVPSIRLLLSEYIVQYFDKKTFGEHHPSPTVACLHC